MDLLKSLNESKEIALTKTDNTTKIDEIKLLLEKKQYDLVIQEIEIILEQFPHDLNSLYLLAETHANIGEYETAINYCKAAIKIGHLSLKFYYLMNQIYEEEKEFEQAKKILN
ncbi:tetratricopeptide repeat protein [Crocosphaera sp.]|uniref:tetratricopeptide repeat protein n=1 Tax=Crocosphaera sp. TaxID=2729996 RepID=UPI003F24F9F6|nr:CDC27 family protein [Crocosphaera sp.]